jgi:multiple antibiotic resistance protein
MYYNRDGADGLHKTVDLLRQKMTVFSAASLLFLVMDPFGNVPLYMAALQGVEEGRRMGIIIREQLIALFVLVAFLFGGQYILSMLQISEPALTAAGGTVLFLISVKMIFPPAGRGQAEEWTGDPFIVPLAIPYVAGPSALASVLLIMNREPSRWPEWLLALLAAWFVSGLIISSSGFLSRVLGRRVLIAIERLMGMILVAIAIQMLMTGIARFVSTI